MDELHPDGIRKSPAQDLFQSVILEQRGATEELKALCKELQTLLEDLQSASPELRPAYQQLIGNQPEPIVRQAKTAPPEMSVTQCKREYERNLVKSAELIRECGQIRQRSKAVRAALQGATPRRSKLVAELAAGLDGNGGWHARDGRHGHHAQDGKDGSNHDGLSKRECQVLRLIVDGLTSREVAAELGISFKTAVTHRASIMSKLDVHETASVVREAIHRGLV